VLNALAGVIGTLAVALVAASMISRPEQWMKFFNRTLTGRPPKTALRRFNRREVLYIGLVFAIGAVVLLIGTLSALARLATS